MNSPTAPAPSTCDICHEAIEANEKFHDDGSEVVHTACVSGWIRLNYGRESLHA